MRIGIAFALLFLSAFSFLLLISGGTHLGWLLPGGLPLGNALAAAALCGGAGAAVALSARHTVLRAVALVSLVAAVAWLPISIALAGNLALNFGGATGLAWMILSLGTLMLVLCCVVWALVRLAFAKLRQRSAP